MEVYLAGTAVTLTIPLQDRSGNQIEADTIEYRVVKGADVVVVDRISLDTFVSGSSEATVEVPANCNDVAEIPATITNNQVDQFNTRESRTVELYVTTAAGNTIVLAKSYALEPQNPLVVGLNSFQTLTQADLVALDIPDTSAWNDATEHEKMAALIEARSRICQLNFTLLNSNISWGQDNFNYVPEGAYQSPYATSGSRLFIFSGNLALLTPTQYGNLPIRFRAALCKAQVAEANAILGGDPVEARRQEGLMLESIGEVKQMFRPGKPINMPVSRQTLRYLSQFISFAKRIGRG